jgi:hypothetical protein
MVGIADNILDTDGDLRFRDIINILEFSCLYPPI